MASNVSQAWISIRVSFGASSTSSVVAYRERAYGCGCCHSAADSRASGDDHSFGLPAVCGAR